MQNHHSHTIDDQGRLVVRNLSAFWLPELTVRDVIHGTAYVVTGSYEGGEPITRKLERLLLEIVPDESADTVNLTQMRRHDP